ncbi:hypothetical protein [Streptomyces sp. NPDC001401]|uniref:hypothetical protein n=1 Tax=Streptomyces sp. NPDC001401 TaxID=3364570 RepID=UPI0036885FEF
MTWKNELSLGDVLAASVSGVLVAMYRLLRSRRDLITERRANFLLDQLAEIALTLESGGTHASRVLTARLRFLPSELKLSFLKDLADTRFSPQGEEPLKEQWKQAGTPAGDNGLARWIRDNGGAEADTAISQILEPRRRTRRSRKRAGELR